MSWGVDGRLEVLLLREEQCHIASERARETWTDVDVTEQDPSVCRIRHDTNQIDRSGKRIAENESCVRDSCLSDIDVEREACFADKVLGDWWNSRGESDRSESGGERSDRSRFRSTGNDRVGGSSLDEALEKTLSGSASSSLRLVANLRGDEILSRRENQSGNVGGADRLTVEDEIEGDVLHSNRDVGRIE